MRYPFVVVAVALAFGIVVGAWAPPTVLPTIACLVFAWTLALVAYRARAVLVFLGAMCGGLVAIGALLAFEATRAAHHPPIRQLMLPAGGADASEEPSAEPVWLRGRLRVDASRSSSGTRLSVAVEHVEGQGTLRDTRGGVLLTVIGSGAAERVGEWRAGRTVRLPAILRRPARYLDPAVPDQEVALARRGTTFVGTVKSGLLVDVLERGHVLTELAASTRAVVRASVARHVGRWSVRSAGIVAAILIGDRAGLEDEVEERLQVAGIYHVIAISGGNVAILTGLLLWGLHTLGFGPRTSNASAIALLLAYGLVVEGGSSVARATMMAVTYLAARLLDHRSPPLNSVAVSVAAILTFDPLALFDAGFLLTFGATIAILVGVPRLTPTWPWASHRLTAGAFTLLAASLCAEAALLPVTASAFSRVTFLGLALNFVAIPLMTVVQVAGLLVVATSPLTAPVAASVGYAAHVASTGLVESARLADWMPALSRRVPAPGWPIVIAYYGAWVWLLGAGIGGRWPGLTTWARRACVVVIALTGLSIATGGMASAPRSRLRVTMIDVGQGDAMLVQCPDGRSLLIDAGGLAFGSTFDIGARIVAPVLWARDVRRLDYLALTHGDPDHIGGAASVLQDFAPREVWEGVPVPRSEPLSLLRSDAAKRRADWRTLRSGDAWSLGGVQLRVLHPPPPDWERQRVRNDDSLVIDVRFGGVSILFTGDISREVERQIAHTIEPAAVRLVKVPHHGSLTSSSREFIEATRPAVAFVSAGRANRFGHPVEAVLARYREAGAAIFRTDRDGAITIDTDGRSVEISTWTGRRLQLKAESR